MSVEQLTDAYYNEADANQRVVDTALDLGLWACFKALDWTAREYIKDNRRRWRAAGFAPAQVSEKVSGLIFETWIDWETFRREGEFYDRE